MEHRCLRIHGQAADPGWHPLTAEKAALFFFDGRRGRVNAWIESINFSMAGAALLLSVMGLWITAVVPGFDRWRKHFFISYFLIFMLCCVSSIVETAAQYFIVTGPVFYFLLFLETLLLMLPLPMLTVYLLHCCGENMRKSMLFQIVLGLWAIMFIILISAMFIQGFFYVTPKNEYYRGPLYPLFLLPVIVIMLFNLAGINMFPIRQNNTINIAGQVLAAQGPSLTARTISSTRADLSSALMITSKQRLPKRRPFLAVVSARRRLHSPLSLPEDRELLWHSMPDQL